MDERLKRLIARRQQAATARTQMFASRKAIGTLADQEGREDLSTEEDAEFRKLTADIAAQDADIAGYDERIKELSDELARENTLTEGAAAVRRAQAASIAVTEDVTYRKGNGQSYLKDLARAALGMDGADESRARLARHAQDVATRPEYRAGLNGTDGTGGYFVPPSYLVSQYVELARATRPTADAVTNQPLPGGTDSMNIPKIATGASVAAQDGQGTAVSETDMTDATIPVSVVTIAGQQSVSQQLIDQSPINFDDIVFKDLMRAHGVLVDTQVISGTNANGQVKGILTASNTISIAYTDTTPTVQELYGKLVDATQRVHTQRFEQATVIVMHPRRWAWIQNSFDGVNRPLVVPSGPGQNSIATFDNAGTMRVVGELLGLPVLTDPNIPTNLGTGTNEDVILVMKADDLILWESQVRSRALPEVLSNTLQVRLQVYSYIAFTAERQPKSIVKIGGTGLVTPTF